MINGLLIERGEATNILRSLLQSAIYYLPSYMCVDVSEVIYELLLLARPAVCIALENVLQVNGFVLNHSYLFDEPILWYELMTPLFIRTDSFRCFLSRFYHR